MSQEPGSWGTMRRALVELLKPADPEAFVARVMARLKPAAAPDRVAWWPAVLRRRWVPVLSAGLAVAMLLLVLPVSRGDALSTDRLLLADGSGDALSRWFSAEGAGDQELLGMALEGR